MCKTFVPLAVLLAFLGNAAAQTPSQSFQPVGSTGKLLTTESKEHWAKVYASYKAANSVKQALHISPEKSAASLLTAKTPARESEKDAGATSPLWFGANRRGGLFAAGGAGF